MIQNAELPMSKRAADDDTDARKRVALESHLVAMPAEIIELIALAAGPSEYRALAATCTRMRRLLTQDAGRQERAKTQFSKEVVSYFNSGVLTYHQLPNGARHGIAQTVLSPYGETVISTYVDDKPHGPCFTRNKDGVVITSVNYVRGKKQGKEEFRFDNGQRSRERHYRDGIMHGITRRWHENGRIAERYTIIDGLSHGTEKAWLADGTCIRRQRWWRNKRHGAEMQLDGNRNPMIFFWFNGDPVY